MRQLSTKVAKMGKRADTAKVASNDAELTNITAITAQ